MTFLYRALKIKSITVLALGTVMLFSCKTNMKDVDAIGNRNNMPEMSGENMELFYSDSALLKYKVITPLYNKYNQDDKKYDEFPKGIHAELYEKDGSMVGSITSKYAKKLEEEMLWELRNEVVVINAEEEVGNRSDVLGYEKRDRLFRSLFSAHFRGPDYRGE